MQDIIYSNNGVLYAHKKVRERDEMEIKQEYIEKFKDIHKDDIDFKNYSEKQIEEIARGVAGYYLTLFTIYQCARDINNLCCTTT